jgi:uncharacterized protein (DUF1810 family)
MEDVQSTIAMSTNDPFYLQRFVDAQEPVYDSVVAELHIGAK